MAAALLRDVMAKDDKLMGVDIEVRSAGVSAQKAAPATELATEVMMAEYGIDLKAHRSNPLTGALVEWADLIVTMTRGHRSSVIARFPGSHGKVTTAGAFCKIHGDVRDPLLKGTVEAYRRCAEHLAQCVRGLVAWLKEDGRRPVDSPAAGSLQTFPPHAERT